MTPHLADIPVLTTERLTLRAPKASDFEPYAAFRMSERAKGVGGPYSRYDAYQQFGELFAHWVIRGYGRWIVADRRDDTPYGVVGLYHPEEWPEPEIAWQLFEAGEGRGYAAEASLATRDYAYQTLGWETLISAVMPWNTRAIALAERMGAARESTFEHPDLGPLEIYRHPSREPLA